jgi:hypothetical protein
MARRVRIPSSPERELSVITSDDLATTTIRHVIFHDVPEKIDGGGNEPLLSDIETTVTSGHHLGRRFL